MKTSPSPSTKRKFLKTSLGLGFMGSKLRALFLGKPTLAIIPPHRSCRRSPSPYRNHGVRGMIPPFFMMALVASTLSLSAVETVTVDFATDKGVATYRATGFLHSFTVDTPATLVNPLKPKLFRTYPEGAFAIYSRATTLGAKVQSVLSDGYGYGPNPGTGGDYTTWENLVKSYVNYAKANGQTANIQWDIWNEPNYSFFWTASQAQYFETWRRAYIAIRAIDPTAVIVGPSVSEFDLGFIQNFLTYAKANNVLPNIISWHDFGGGDNIPANVQNLRSWLTANGINITRFSINENILQSEFISPGATVHYIAGIENSGVESASHACWGDATMDNCWNDSLDGILTEDGLSPRSTWWAYKGYADVVGRIVGLTPGVSAAGVAGHDVATKQASVILGRNGGSGDVAVRFVNFSSAADLNNGTRVHVVVNRIPYSGYAALGAVTKMIETDYTIANNEFTVLLTSFGASDAFTIKLTPGTAPATNTAPVANTQSVTTAANTAKAIVLTGSDADANPLTYAIVTAPAHGTLTGTPPNVTFTPTANYSGADSFTFKVNDGKVDSTAATVSITVTPVNRAPVANAQSVTTAANTAKAIVLTGSDADANPLTYAIVTAPAHGTLTGTPPNVTFTPTANYSGADSFTFKVNDGKVDSTAATVNITVTPVNHAPVANAQSVTTAANTAKAIVLTGSDSDGDPLTFTVLTAPAHGTLTGTAPNGTYTPTANYTGADSFTFRVSDGKTTSAAATVSITVTAVNHAPVATAQAVTGLVNTAKAITLTGSDSDGNALTYRVGTAPLHGTISGTLPNATYTPVANYMGTDSFTFLVNDGKLDSTAATVGITINGLPLPSTTALLTEPFPIHTVGIKTGDGGWDLWSNGYMSQFFNFPSAGKYQLQFTARGDLAGPDLPIMRVDLDGKSQSVTITQNTYKVYTLTFDVTQGNKELRINFINDYYVAPADRNLIVKDVKIMVAPVVVNVSPAAVGFTFTTPSNIPKSFMLSATDPNGDALTFSIDTAPVHGTLSGTPPAVTYTPVSTYVGADSFKYKASDGKGGVGFANVGITVTAPINRAPVALAKSVSMSANTSTNITLTGTDADNDKLTFTVVTQPLHGTLTGVSPSLTYKPTTSYNGADSFTFKANDGKVDSAVATVSFQVTAPVAAQAVAAPTSFATYTVDTPGQYPDMAYLHRPYYIQFKSNIDGATDWFSLFLPTNFDPNKAYPVWFKFKPFYGSGSHLTGPSHAWNYCDNNQVIVVGCNLRGTPEAWFGDNERVAPMVSGIGNDPAVNKKAVADTMEILNQLLHMYKISYVAASGASMGGYSSLRFLSKLPQTHVGAVVASCPAIWFRPYVQTGSDALYNSISNGFFNDKFVTILHGTADDTVPVENSRTLTTAAPNKTWWKLKEIPGGGHTDYFAKFDYVNFGYPNDEQYGQSDAIPDLWQQIHNWEAAHPSITTTFRPPLPGWTPPSNWYFPKSLYDAKPKK